MKRIALTALALVLVFTIVGLFLGTHVSVTIGGVQPVQRSPGDVNGDGTLNIADVSAIANFLFGVPPATPLAATAASPDELARIVALEEGQAALDDAVSLQAETQGSLLDRVTAIEDRVTAIEGPATPIEGFTTIGPNAQGYPEYTHDQTGIVFVKLPGGTFQMGSPDTEPNRAGVEEGPVHEVTLSPFLIAKTEVTQAEYLAVMGVNPSFNGDCANRPVEQVSWDDLKAADGFLARTGLSLPTEAQWEYAARGGTSTAFSFGDDCNDALTCDPCATAEDFMWWCGNSNTTGSGTETHSVASKQPNPFGLHDVHGNVREWCEDVYDRAFYSSPGASGPDPVSTTGSIGVISRVFRGGDFQFAAASCRSARRHRDIPSLVHRTVGFRPAFWPLP